MNNNTKSWLSVVIPAIILYFGLSMMGIDPVMVRYITVTITGILAFLFNIMPVVITSLSLMLAYVAFGIAPVSVVFSGWMAESIWVTFGCLFLVVVIGKTTLMDRLIYFLISKTNGSYLGILFALIVLAIISNLAIPGCMVAVAIVLIAYKLCEYLEFEDKRAEAGIMIGAVATAYLGVESFILCPGYFTLITDAAKSVVDLRVDYFTTFYHNWPFFFVVVVEILALNKMFKPKKFNNVKEKFTVRLKEMPPVTGKEKRIVLLLASLLIYLVTFTWHQQPMWYGFIIITALLCTPMVNVGSEEDVKEVNYSILIFMVSCLGIGNAAIHLGIGEAISQYVASNLVVENNTTLIMFSFLIAFLMNLFMTPFAALSSFGATLANIALAFEVNFYPVAYAFFFGCQTVVFPYQTAVFAMLYSMGNLKLKDFIKFMLVRAIIWAVAIYVISNTYWSWIGIS